MKQKYVNEQNEEERGVIMAFTIRPPEQLTREILWATWLARHVPSHKVEGGQVAIFRFPGKEFKWENIAVVFSGSRS